MLSTHKIRSDFSPHWRKTEMCCLPNNTFYSKISSLKGSNKEQRLTSITRNKGWACLWPARQPRMISPDEDWHRGQRLICVTVEFAYKWQIFFSAPPSLPKLSMSSTWSARWSPAVTEATAVSSEVRAPCFTLISSAGQRLHLLNFIAGFALCSAFKNVLCGFLQTEDKLLKHHKGCVLSALKT